MTVAERPPRPAVARSADVVVGTGTPSVVHLARGRARGREGRRDRLRLRSRPRHHRDEEDGQGGQHLRARRPRRRRQGHPERRGPAADPLHEHLRPGAGLDDVALQRPGGAAARAEADAPRPRQQHGGDDGRRRWRRGLRARRPADDRRLDLRRQPLRPHRPRRGRGSRPGARPAPRPARRRTPLHLHRRPVQQRLGAEQHRRLVAHHRVDVHGQPRDRARRQPCATRHPRRRARAARSTWTATTST